MFRTEHSPAGTIDLSMLRAKLQNQLFLDQVLQSNKLLSTIIEKEQRKT